MDKYERDAYNEMDRNCNACRHLERVASAPRGKPYATWQGKCKSSTPRFDVHPYPLLDGVFNFHPNDSMNMPCWEARG